LYQAAAEDSPTFRSSPDPFVISTESFRFH
jgi:hypothetical protein